MGKKPSQSSMKISKNDKKQQHPLNSLIKNLRPKVYIIDSSNFKNLVQELTGNGNGNENPPVLISSPPPPFVSTSPPIDEVRSIIEIEDHAYQENSLEFSFDSSTCFSTPSESPDLQYRPTEPANYILENSKNMSFSSLYGDIDHAYQENSLGFSFDSSTCFSTPSDSPDLQYRAPEPTNYTLENSQNMDFSSLYGDIESLLLEMDQVSNYAIDDSCYAMIQQEACVYDYDFSGLI
ncbi:Hypothetical predicted protein [Olea europaea subsp. europaea]|uniref:VQ domain-containing protein n=1 Tax=Olea europaea subsp. europaea TaxID=158383 RepID=A0A8S0QFQ4_OLEEU|nr:Hypothetical predicted protein [Olea europaea subsp. europaea]